LSDDEKKHMLIHPNLKEAERSVNRAIKQPLTEEQYKLAVETQLIVDEVAWRWWILQGMNHSIAEPAALLELPITVLASEDDPVITSDVIKQRVMPVLKQARLITTRQVGHLSPLEAPEWIAAQIRNIVPVEKEK
jgi:sigma-B regulation protein RsbQ